MIAYCTNCLRKGPFRPWWLAHFSSDVHYLTCNFISGTNVALHKKAYQIDTWMNTAEHAKYSLAANAVDGHAESNYSKGHCSATQANGANPKGTNWLVVDLGSMHSIDHVVILNRKDCCRK